jgi:hypothetical protein
LQVRLAKKRWSTPRAPGRNSDDPPILVEVWAHQGSRRAPKKAKIMTDALKMLWVEATFCAAKARKILLLSDPLAAAHFGRMPWMAAALRHFAIEVKVVDLPAEYRAAVHKAQGASSDSQVSEVVARLRAQSGRGSADAPRAAQISTVRPRTHRRCRGEAARDAVAKPVGSQCDPVGAPISVHALWRPSSAPQADAATQPRSFRCAGVSSAALL